MLYEVRVAANKGLGLFAKQRIPRGTRILAEKPLIALRPGQRPSDILTYAQELDVKSKETLLGLSWHPGDGINRIGRWYEALDWMVRNRVIASERIAQERGGDGIGEASAILPGRLSKTLGGLGEAFRILSIFRSNSFNLASSAILPSETYPPSPLPSTALDTLEPSKRRETTNRTIPDRDTGRPSPSPTYELALFPAIARINHSCIPNAQANYHPSHATFNVHATRDIPAGEEVSINYLPEHGQLRDQRVSKLEDGYGFMCNCPACNLHTHQGRQGERSRKEVQFSMKKTRALLADSTIATEMADAGYSADGMPESLPNTASDEEKQQIDALRMMPDNDRHNWLRGRELEAINAMLAMYQKEGIVGREVASMYYHVARLQRSTNSYEEAAASAEAGLKLEEICLGVDHPAYLEALALVDRIREDAAAA